MVFGHVLAPPNQYVGRPDDRQSTTAPCLAVDINAGASTCRSEFSRVADRRYRPRRLDRAALRVLIDIGQAFSLPVYSKQSSVSAIMARSAYSEFLKGTPKDINQSRWGFAALGIGSHFGRVGLGTIRVHQIAINGLDTVVVTDRFLHRRAAPQIEFG